MDQALILKKSLEPPSFHFKYDQMCITVKVLLRGVKSNDAFEILNSEGPFAVLPFRWRFISNNM